MALFFLEFLLASQFIFTLAEVLNLSLLIHIPFLFLTVGLLDLVILGLKLSVVSLRFLELGLSGSQPRLLSVCFGAKMPNAVLSISYECGPWDSFSIHCSSGHCSSSHNSSRRHWRKAEYSSLPDACEVMLELQTLLQNKLAKTAA